MPRYAISRSFTAAEDPGSLGDALEQLLMSIVTLHGLDPSKGKIRQFVKPFTAEAKGRSAREGRLVVAWESRHRS